jgi:tetratricopeptide (TPR) repeat protein
VGALVLLFAAIVPMSAPCRADAGPDSKLAELSAQIARHPGDQQLLVRRARVHVERGQFDLAAADIAAAETLGDPVETAFVHGVLLYRSGDLPGSRRQFDRYLRAHPHHYPSLDYRARLLRDTGEYEAALADYHRLIALDPNLAPGYYLAVADMLAAMPEHGIDAALALLDARMAEVGTLSQLQRRAIALEQSRGHYDSAIERLATLDEKLRATPEWKAEMARLQLRAGRPDEALAYATVAREQLAGMKRTAARQRLGAELAELERRARDAAARHSSP